MMMLSAAVTTRGWELQCVRVCVRQQLSAVGEDILCVLERQRRCDDVRVFVLERLSAAAECICSLFQREVDALRTLMDAHSVKDPRFDVPHLPVCKEEVSSEHGSEHGVVQEEEPGPPHMMTEEHKELLQRPEEEAATDDGSTLPDWKARSDPLSDFLPVCKEESSPDQQEKSPGVFPEEPKPLHIKVEPEEVPACAEEEANDSTLTFLAVKSEGAENAETEPLASTSAQPMTSQADAEDCGTSRPTSDDQLLSSSHCSESDTEDSDEWDAGEDRSPLKVHETRHVGDAQTLPSPSDPKSQDPKSSSSASTRRSRKGAKTIGCHVCGKTFSRNEHLSRHMKTHTGEKPFSCTVCGKAWGEKGDLTKHMRIHTGEKPFSCPFCCKGFGQVCDLKKHVRAHTGEKPYVCTVCGKGCSQMGDLKKHMMTHTGERPFDCAVCGKNFYLNQHLKRHMKIHEREKPRGSVVV